MESWRRPLAEFGGTLTVGLVTGIVARKQAGSAMSAFAIGGTYASLTYTLGHISGANLNPAVTLSMCMKQAMSWKEALLQYIPSQLLGGLCARFACSILLGGEVAPASTSGSLLKAGITEFLYTGILVTTVIKVALSRNPSQQYGMAVGSVHMAGRSASASLSHGFFNPAIALTVLPLQSALVYSVAQFAGAASAVILSPAIETEDVEYEPNTLAAKLISEYIGTYSVNLTWGLCMDCEDTRPLAAAAALLSQIVAHGPTSGAHLNPSSCAAATVKQLFPYKDAVLYTATQLLAGALSGFTVRFLKGKANSLKEGSVVGMMALEVFFTGCYVASFLAVATRGKSVLSELYGVAIATAYGSSVCAAASLTDDVLMSPATSAMVLCAGGSSHTAARVAAQWVGGIGGAMLSGKMNYTKQTR